MNEEAFNALILDESKHIDGDIVWNEDEDHSPSVEFRVEVLSDAGYPMFIRGSFNPLIDALTFAMIYQGVGRIYALDMGKDHHNPSCINVGEVHKHNWSDKYRDKDAYVPIDITAQADEPVKVWKQFCHEARIIHYGELKIPPPLQGELDL